MAVAAALVACSGPAPTTTTVAPRAAASYARAVPHGADRPVVKDVAPPPVVVVRAVNEAFVVYPHPAWGTPEGLLARNDWGQSIALPVVETVTRQDEEWLEVRLPTRPNGSTGWVRAADVRARRIHERIEVDLSEHLLTRIHRGEPVGRIRVGVGTRTFPTTPGRFFVWARLRYDPPGVYGVGALGLSGFSEVITDWVGGGRMAIHGTGDPTDRGKDVSHGCVRVYNAQMLRLADVAMGTPVLIRP
jgi:hypothetical protein